MKKTLAVAVASTLMLALPLHADDKAPKGKDYVILKVDGEDIKKSEVDTVWKTIFPGDNPPDFDKFDEKIRDNVLRGVASEHMLLKEAEKSGVQNSPEVKERLASVEHQIIIQEFLKDKTKNLVSDDKVKALYDERIKATAVNEQEEVHARHILVKSEDEAKAVEKKLKKGEDFTKLAKEKSQDPTNAAAGGDLGWFKADQMTPEFSKAAFALKKGEVSAPVKTEFGWHIIKLDDRRKVPAVTFDQMKDRLRQELANKAMRQYVDSLMKDTKITVIDADGHSKELSALPEPKQAPSAGAADNKADKK